jgi:hypothetical protein
MKRTTEALLICLCLFAVGGVSEAMAESQAAEAGSPVQGGITGWNLQFSLYTRHWDPSPEHNNHQHMITLEARWRDDWLAGLSVFENSFYQDTQLVYVGKTWSLPDSPNWYFKVIGGLVHGYKEPYQDKIPLNGLGVAPAIIPSLGYRRRHLMIEAHFAGLSAMTLTAGIRF